MIITMLVVVSGASFYVFYRFWYLIPPSTISRAILICVTVFLVVSPFISLGLGTRFPFPVTSFLYQVGTSWLIIMIYIVIIFVMLDLVRITGLLPLKQFMFNSWTGFCTLSLIVLVLMTYGNVNYHNKKRVELTIKTDKNIKLEKSLKIVAISDLHLGYGNKTKEFQKWVKLINQEEPDIVLIAGDAIDNSVKPLYDRNFTDIFKDIKTKYGIYLAPGNHEYISNIDESIDFLTKADVVVLKDAAVLVDNSCYILGRDDRSNQTRKTIAELTDTLDKSRPIILIDHQPYHFDEVEENNIDLYIAGHSHDGQTFPITLITNALYEVSYGYKKKGNTHFYVTSGIGIWGGKFRIGSRSEYVVINFSSSHLQ